jgi:anti-sigma B factor antagonist
MVQHSITLAFDGELETQNWEQFRDAIIDAAGDGITAIILDLGEVTFFDSSAIRALLGARNVLQSRGVTIHLGATSRIVSYVVEITGIGAAFPPWPPAAAA